MLAQVMAAATKTPSAKPSAQVSDSPGDSPRGATPVKRLFVTPNRSTAVKSEETADCVSLKLRRQQLLALLEGLEMEAHVLCVSSAAYAVAVF
jgi:hypothetical protein